MEFSAVRRPVTWRQCNVKSQQEPSVSSLRFGPTSRQHFHFDISTAFSMIAVAFVNCRQSSLTIVVKEWIFTYRKALDSVCCCCFYDEPDVFVMDY